MKKLVIFDLDGTLLNTLADLAASTNQALRLHGFPQHTTDAYKFFVGNGINKLFERALPEGAKTETNVQRIREAFLGYYEVHNTDLSRPYPGIPELLKGLQHGGATLAVASNKYQRATAKLIAHYFPEIRFAAVLGQREGVPSKPDPTVVCEILASTGVPAAQTWYVGDSAVDMETARRSGVCACGVTWGFRPRTELIEAGADYIADTPEQIGRWVGETAEDGKFYTQRIKEQRSGRG